MKKELQTFDELHEALTDFCPNAEKKIDEERFIIYLNDRYNKRISYWEDKDYCCAGYIIEVYSIAYDDYIIFSEDSSAQKIFNMIECLKN